MRLKMMLAVALAIAVSSAVAAEPAPAKRKPVRHWHGYGFLPGYRTPEQIEREDAYLYWRRHPGYFWYGGPRFYRGRWNGGGFGPCWTQTPIGPVWNCGR
jgi:hypothetical protein